MKKLILILAVLISAVGFAQTVPVGYGGMRAAEFQGRIIDSSGTYLPNVYPPVIDNLYRQGIYPLNIMVPAGYYDGGLGSQIPADGSGDFTWERNSTSTTVGADGYIHPILVNEPRISFEDGIPYSSLEKKATQLITEDVPHSYWIKSGATIEGDASTAGEELVTNGDFATDSDWTKGPGWTISGGAAHCDGTQTSNSFLSGTVVTPNITKTYHLEVVVSNSTSNGVQLEYGGVSDAPLNGIYVGNGTWLLAINPITTNTNIHIRANSTFVGDIESISVKQVSGYSSPYLDEDGNNDYGAYLMTATSANGEVEYDKTITSGLDYDNSIYIKSVTGTGNILIKDVNNAETVLTDGQQLADNWYKYSINSQSSTTTGYAGLKLVTSGDEILIYQPNLIQADAPRSLIKLVSGTEVTCLGDVVSNTPPTGTTKITEYFDDGTTNEITTIPSTYTLTQNKNYTKIIME